MSRLAAKGFAVVVPDGLWMPSALLGKLLCTMWEV